MSEYELSDKMKEYLDASTELEREEIAEIGQEAYDASQHWVNNPLIKPISKLGMLNDALAKAWDEGHTHCFHVENPHNPVKGNPYREETE